MSSSILQGKRVLITQADAFMGPVLCEVFAEQGASVMADTQSLIDPRTPAAAVAAVGRIDVLVVNLAVPAPFTAATEVSDTEWRDTFASLVDPLPLGRLVGAREDAEFAAYLCSDAASCFVGQVFPVCGGWVAR